MRERAARVLLEGGASADVSGNGETAVARRSSPGGPAARGVRKALGTPWLWAVVLPPLLAAPEPEEFSRPGPYPVGVRTLIFVDASRRDEYAEGARTLVTDVWYPAGETARSAEPTTFLEFYGKHREAAARFVEHFGGEIGEVNRRFRTVAVRDAPRRRSRYPLLIFSHGNGGMRHQNAFQLDHLASHGYIIAAPDHTGNAGVTPFPERALAYDRGGRRRSLRDRPLDVSFLIGELLAASREPSSWLFAAIDEPNIGVLGHSMGGVTSCRVAESDSRVKAILPMTAAYGRGSPVPMMLMLAEWDRTMGTVGNGAARVYYAASKGPKYLLTLKRAGHFSFTDMDRINPRFGDGIGRDRKSGAEFQPVERSKQLVNAYSLAFFDRYLKGAPGADEFLEETRDPREMSLQLSIPKREEPPRRAVGGAAGK